MELVEGIARGKDPADEVALKLVTVENQDGPEKLQKQLSTCFRSSRARQCSASSSTSSSSNPRRSTTARSRTDTGWKILLGRGLDIFQRMSDSPFDLATKYQKYRELKGFGITYLRDSTPGNVRARPEGN